MKLSKLLASLLLSLALSSCKSIFKISDFQANITLPASQDCYGFNVLSGKEQRLKADSPECIRKKAHSIWLDSENYKILRRDIEKNCQLSECKQLTGAFDQLFLTIDSALEKIPNK